MRSPCFAASVLVCRPSRAELLAATRGDLVSDLVHNDDYSVGVIVVIFEPSRPRIRPFWENTKA